LNKGWDQWWSFNSAVFFHWWISLYNQYIEVCFSGPGAKRHEAKLILGGCVEGGSVQEKGRENVRLFVCTNPHMYNSSLESRTCIISTTVTNCALNRPMQIYFLQRTIISLLQHWMFIISSWISTNLIGKILF